MAKDWMAAVEHKLEGWDCGDEQMDLLEAIADAEREAPPQS